MKDVPGPKDVRYLEQAWEANPWWNISLLPGRRSGVLVGDADPRHGGSLEALWDRGWPRVTPTERTGGGGWHVYVRCPPGGFPTVHTYGPGLEVLADGGHVIMAPSLHRNRRRYAWLPGLALWDVPIAELPEEVLADIRSQSRKEADAATVPAPALSGEELAKQLPRAAHLVTIAVERAHRRTDGGRHFTLIWLANRLAFLGLRDEVLGRYLFDYQARVKGGWSE